MNHRRSGVLYPISSFPGLWGQGDFGPSVYTFIDWLAKTEQTLWQILPLSFPDNTGSPYASPSANAIDSRFLSPEILLKDQWINEADFNKAAEMSADKTFNPFEFVLYRAFTTYKNQLEKQAAVKDFFRENSHWLDDTALFMNLHAHYSSSWYHFPDCYRNRDDIALKEYRSSHSEEIEKFKFQQYLLFDQWIRLKKYANERHIQIIGDIPIFVSGDSADVWANRPFFKLDKDGIPLTVTGVPPDLFTATGQLWGQPHYDWDAMRKSDFSWWKQRIAGGLKTADIIRIDHFRGFCAAWEVPFGAPTAEHGKWVTGPGEEVFSALHNTFPDLSIIAEDLGVITEDVDALRKKFRYPGMKILQFAFNSDMESSYLPKNFDADDRFVCYTGTHDNNTSRGWFRQSTDHEKYMLSQFAAVTEESAAWILIEMSHLSSAMWSIIPIQDILNLGEEARINVPGTITGNWQWKLTSWDPSDTLTANFKQLTQKSGRSL